MSEVPRFQKCGNHGNDRNHGAHKENAHGEHSERNIIPLRSLCEIPLCTLWFPHFLVSTKIITAPRYLNAYEI